MDTAIIVDSSPTASSGLTQANVRKFPCGCERIFELHVLHEGVLNVGSIRASATQAWLTNLARSQD